MGQEVLQTHLKRATSLADAPAEMITALAAGSRLTAVLKGDRIFTEGAPCEGAVVVVDGQCSLAVEEPARTLLQVLGPGDSTAFAHAISGLPMNATLHASKPSQVVIISRDALRAAMLKWTEMSVVAIHEAGLTTGRLGGDWASSRIDDVGTRVLERLRADERLGEVSQKDLADALGLRRETVSRVISDLVERGLLERKGPRVVVVSSKTAESSEGDDE